MVEIAKAATVAELCGGIVEETACNDARAFDRLIGVGDVNVKALCNTGRPNRGFPAVDARAFDGERKKDVGIAQRVMIEEVERVRLEVGEIESPSAKRNSEAKFALLVGFAAERQETRIGGSQEVAGNGGERRCLIEAAVGCAEDPIQPGNAQSGAEARIGFVLDNIAREMRVAEATVEGEPVCEAKLIFCEEAEERAVRLTRLWRGRRRSIGVDEAKERVVLLGEAVEAELCVMTAASHSESCEAAFVVRVVVAGGDGRVVECESGGRQIAVISGAIPVEEWRDSKEHTWIDGVDPGEIAEDIAFSFDIARANFLLIERIGNLEIVRAGGANETELIAGRGIEDERGEEADVVIVVVKFLRFGRHEADVGARTAEAGVPGETFGVIAEAELAVGGVITAIGCDEFGFAVALEAGTGNYVECSVGAIAVFGGLAAALDFDNVNILGIELRADVCSDVRVGDGDAVHEPGNLMAAANVKLVMNHVRAGGVAGDEIEAVGAGRARKFGDFRASDSRGRG